MSKRKATDAEIAAAIHKHGVLPASRILGITKRTAQIRRRLIEKRTGEKIVSPILPGNPGRTNQYIEKGRVRLDLPNGVVVSASDCHYWPGFVPLMHRALLRLLPDIRPDLFVLNGDVADFAKLSRFPDVEWSHKPEPWEEVETCQDRLHEIVSKLKRGCRRIWTCGNHDSRWERYIIQHADRLKGTPGTSLKDWFPDWETAWDVQINSGAHNPGDRVTLQHRFTGGVHHAYNDALRSGRTFVSADKHAAQITQITDLNGTRWGVDNGCIADPRHVAFAYGENKPHNHRDAFAVLTFKQGRLLPPELVTRWSEDEVVFRGNVIHV